MAGAIHRECLVEGVQVYVRQAELLRVATRILLDIDGGDEELQLDFVLAPLTEQDKAEEPLRIPTSFTADAVELSIPQRTLFEESPFAKIIGYPRFSSRDEDWVTSQRHMTPGAEDELTAEIIIPEPGSKNLAGTMGVFLVDQLPD